MCAWIFLVQGYLQTPLFFKNRPPLPYTNLVPRVSDLTAPEGPGGGKMRDPGNEVESKSVDCVRETRAAARLLSSAQLRHVKLKQLEQSDSQLDLGSPNFNSKYVCRYFWKSTLSARFVYVLYNRTLTKGRKGFISNEFEQTSEKKHFQD